MPRAHLPTVMLLTMMVTDSTSETVPHLHHKLFNESAWLWCLITRIEKQLRPPSWFLHSFYTLLYCFLNIMLSLTFLKNSGAFLPSETFNHAQRSQKQPPFNSLTTSQNLECFDLILSSCYFPSMSF